MGWADGPLLGFDTETTGVNVELDHVITASLVTWFGEGPVQSETVWLNHNVSIPVGASQIHGITKEMLDEKGGDPAQCLESVVQVLALVLDEGTPVVGMNCPFDFTILDRNCRRYGVTPLGERTEISPVIDVMVLDKLVDPFRKGSGMRKLSAICPMYLVDGGKAHDSAADALAAMRIAWRISRLYPAVARLSARDLHRGQRMWKAHQDASFAKWLKGQQKSASDVDGQWPVRRLPSEDRVAEPELVEVPLWE